MNTAKRTAKFKGAVLIMILAVMTVLIILLAGSIAVVYSAHNRAVVKYSESQGYYTARSILDNFFAELSESSETKGSDNTDIGDFYALDLENYGVNVKPDLGIGRALELDLYKATVTTKDASGRWEEWVLEYCSENKDALAAQINTLSGTSIDASSIGEYQRGGSISSGLNTLCTEFVKYYVNLDSTNSFATDTLTKSDGTTVNGTTFRDYYNQFKPVAGTASGGANIIRYDLSNFDGFGSGTIDTDGDGSPDTNSQFGKLADNGSSKAWITVEVMERIYDFGEGNNALEKFLHGVRRDDYICAKVTAHVIYDNEEITTTQIWESSAPPITDSPAGLTSLGTVDTTTSLTAVGDAVVLSTGHTTLGNNTTISGNTYVEGSYSPGTTTPKVTMNPDNSFFAGKFLKINTNPPQAEGLPDGAIFYGGVTQLWNTGASFGTNDHRINLITGRFEPHNNMKEFYGRIFCEQYDVITNGQENPWGAYTETNPFSVYYQNGNRINADVYTDYLGVPKNAVYVVLDEVNETATFKLNYRPDGTAINPGDPDENSRIDKKLGVNGELHVLHGISIIADVQGKDFGITGEPWYNTVNVHEQHYAVNAHGTPYVDDEGNDIKVSYFTDCRAVDHTLTNIDPNFSLNHYGVFFNDDDTTPNIADSTATATNKTYKVYIDWSNVDLTASNLKIDYDTTTAIGGSCSFEKPDFNIDYYADKDAGVWTLDNDFKKVFEFGHAPDHINHGDNNLSLVGNDVTDSSKFTLPTHQSLYKEYFFGSIDNGQTGDYDSLGNINPAKPYPETFNKDTGAFSMPLPTDATTESKFELFLAEHAITAEAVLAGIDIVGPVDVSNIPALPVEANPVTVAAGGGDTVAGVDMPAYDKVISSNGYIPANDNNTYYIDARSQNLELQLGAGNNQTTFTGNFIIYGNKNVRICVPGNQNVPDGTNQVVQLGTSGHSLVFATADIFSGDWKNHIVVGDSVSTINGGELTPSPNVDWYFSKKITDVEIAMGGGTEAMLCGYIVAPSVNFRVATNANGNPRETWYYGDKINSSNSKYTIFGSVFSKTYDGGQHAGVCYIPRDVGFIDEGTDPVLNKNGIYRARR